MHKGKRMCVVIGGRARMIFLCSILLVSLLLVYGGAERESEVYDYRLLIGNSALVKSCPIRLTLPPCHLSATLNGAPNLIRRFNPNFEFKTPLTSSLMVV